MALGATLAAVLNLVKSEIQYSLSVGTANDALIKQSIESKQEQLADSFNWAELKDQWPKTLTAGIGGRYTAFPTTDVIGTAYSINFARPLSLRVRYNLRWIETSQGICVDDYITFDSDSGDTADPVRKWDFKPGDRASFEVWPAPTTAQVLRFVGQRKLLTLRTGGTLDSTKTLDLDDQLVALSVAIDLLSAKPKEQAAKIALFNNRFARLRQANVADDERIVLGQGPDAASRKIKYVKVVSI